ncbi:hypothetical protein GTP44_03840 [Duganella sp. FT50W]|uniref:Uncharacterized protein n=1 Tax=Duganella lactea TaxID=2692173 RepID=A0A6L8MGW7_9BURK|nr:hypothetical protein [Duganella lactea]MYM81092.1 hypothetical protein [Duganella lactea]
MALHVVPSAPAPEQTKLKSRTATKPAEMLQCPRCAGREFIETVIGAMIQARKLKGGTRQIICVGCMLKGDRVVVA